MLLYALDDCQIGRPTNQLSPADVMNVITASRAKQCLEKCPSLYYLRLHKCACECTQM